MRTHTRPHVVSRVQAMDVPHHFQSTCQMNDMICININTVTSLIIGIINPLGLFFSIKNNGLIVEIDYHIHRAPKIIMTLSFIVEPNRLFGQGGITNGEHGGQPSQSQTLSFNVYFYK